MIHYHLESVELDLSFTVKFQSVLEVVVSEYGCELDELSYIFCNDDYLLKVNQDYLNHDYYTDIITFDYCEEKLIGGDLFISIDRVRENADSNQVTFENELCRVMFHGVLHLLGFGDKLPEEELQMRALESKCLSLYFA